MPTHNGIGQQFFLEQDAELKRQKRIEYRDVERGAVIYGIDLRLTGIDLFQPNDTERGKDRLHNGLRPGAREPVQPTAVFVEESERDRRQPKKDCIAPDQRIEEEIGTQSA